MKNCDRTESLPMLLPEVSRASHSVLHHTGESRRLTCGPTYNELSMTSDQKLPSLKMSKRPLLSEQKLSLNPLDTEPFASVYRGLIAGHHIQEIAGGLLHTPTCAANFMAPSMQKHGCCRRYVAVFGDQKIMPEQFEFLMGYPIGWTEIDPSETPSSPKSPNSLAGQSSKQRPAE